MKDAPRLSGFTACKPAEPPTGGRAGRFGAAVRGGPWTGLFRGRLIFHNLRVARSAIEQLTCAAPGRSQASSHRSPQGEDIQ